MSALVVEVDGRVLRLEGKRSFRIGRAIEADVVLTAGSVSRQHAELQLRGDDWVLVDAGSQFGTFVDGERITEYGVAQRISVRCGPQAPGADLMVIPAEHYEPASPDLAAPAAPAPPPMPLDEPTSVPSGPAPSGAPAPAPPAPPPAPPAAAPPAPVAPGSERFAPPGAVPPPVPPVPPGAAPAPVVPPGPAGPPATGARPAGAPGLPPAIAGNDATQILAAAPRHPQGPSGQSGPPPGRTGPDLLLVAEGREHRFRHPAQVTVGRRSDCTVVVADPACSRVHGRIDALPGGWAYTNLSNEGTYLDGRKIAERKFDERVSLRLGHPVAGPELTLVPILSAAEEERRIARRRLGRRLVVLGAVATVVVLIGGVLGTAWWLGRDDVGDRRADRDPSSREPGLSGSMEVLTDEELDAAKAATVKITAETTVRGTGQEVAYGGSGSIIREDGLILTNAHVAAPESPGLEQYDDLTIDNPDYLLIHLTDGTTDTNASASYRARVVEADGHLDIAVIEIYATADGEELDEEPTLPTVPVGSSEELRAGDDVTILGFPAVARSEDSITVTTGVISTIINDPDLGPRSELDTDARIAPGNSGGMAINNDAELIGIPTALLSDLSTPVLSGRIRAIDAAKDLIEEAKAETS